MLDIIAAHPFISAFIAYCLIDVVHTGVKNLTGRSKVPREVEERLRRIEVHMGVDDDNKESVLQRLERLEAISGAGPFRVRAQLPQPKRQHELYLDTLNDEKKEER